jgi:hypothetical protein
MTATDKTALLVRANQVRTEVGGFANTASRIGGLFRDIIDSLFGAGELSVASYGAYPSNTAAQNDVAIAAAVAAAIADNASLFWPFGAYLSSSTLANLHTVKHRGPGRIVRGSDTFYVDPKYGQTNRLYVATTGLAGNDGLSSAQPMLTAAGLFSAMANYGPVLDGTWEGNFAAGTYLTLNASFATPSRNIVTFRGPSVGGPPNVPTAVFSGTGAAASDFGMRATGPGVQVNWRDLRFTLYNHASTNNIALLSDYGSDLWWDNVHVDNSLGQGIYGEDCPIVRGGGMVIDGCRQGVLLNACNMVTLGYGYSDVTKNIVKNCTQAGVEWSRGTNGHCDFVTLQGNAVGIDVMHVSRCHLMTSTLTSNTVAVRARSGGYYLDDGNTYTTNTEKFRNYAGSGETDTDLWTSISERRRAYSVTGVTHTGTVAKTTLLSPWTIPQSFFIAPTAATSTKKIRVVVHGEFTTAGALSQIGVDFDSVVIAVFAAVAPSAGAKFKLEVEVWADGNASQFKSAALYQSGAALQVAQNSPAQNMANAARNLNITGQLANAGDTLKVDRTEVWVSG